MVATYSDGPRIYSVDLMIAYLGIFKPTAVKVNTPDYFDSVIDCETWGDPEKGIFYSPREVLDNPNKYKKHY